MVYYIEKDSTTLAAITVKIDFSDVFMTVKFDILNLEVHINHFSLLSSCFQILQTVNILTNKLF